MDRLWPYAVESERALAALGRRPTQALEALEASLQSQLVSHEEARLGVMMQLASEGARRSAPGAPHAAAGGRARHRGGARGPGRSPRRSGVPGSSAESAAPPRRPTASGACSASRRPGRRRGRPPPSRPLGAPSLDAEHSSTSSSSAAGSPRTVQVRGLCVCARGARGTEVHWQSERGGGGGAVSPMHTLLFPRGPPPQDVRSQGAPSRPCAPRRASSRSTAPRPAPSRRGGGSGLPDLHPTLLPAALPAKLAPTGPSQRSPRPPR